MKNADEIYKKALAKGMIANEQIPMFDEKDLPERELTSAVSETTEEDDQYRMVVLKIPGFKHYKLNPSGNPISKQSDKHTLQRVKAGPNKGDVFTFKNKKTGRLDCILRHYQPPVIRHYEKHIMSHAIQQVPNFKKFTKEVHILQMEFIFTIPANYAKYKIKEIENGIIHYKTTAPDLPDNLKKPVWDALEGYLFDNDSIICSETGVLKRYGIKPGIIIKLKGK